MTDITQPEAIRLAHELDAYHTAPHHKMAAAELRRLQAMTEDQAKALSVTEYVFSERNRLEAQRDELLEALKLARLLLIAHGESHAKIDAAIAKAAGEQA